MMRRQLLLAPFLKVCRQLLMALLLRMQRLLLLLRLLLELLAWCVRTAHDGTAHLTGAMHTPHLTGAMHTPHLTGAMGGSSLRWRVRTPHYGTPRLTGRCVGAPHVGWLGPGGPVLPAL